MNLSAPDKPHIRNLLKRLTLLLVLVVLSIALLVQVMHQYSNALTENSEQELLPKIHEHQRLALNLERLERMGDLVVYASSPELIRRNALSAQVLAYQPSLRQHPQARDTARAVFELLREMRRARQQLMSENSSISQAERRNLQQLEQSLQKRWSEYKQTLFSLQNRLISESTSLQQQNLRQITTTNNLILMVAWGGIGLLILLILLIGSKLNRHLIRPVTYASQALAALDQGKENNLHPARYQELDTIYQAVNNLQETLYKLQQMATRDSLTGCINRGYFMERACQVLGYARQSRRPLTLVMLDIDHFKKVNDRFGHAIGDQALIQCCRWIRDTLDDALGQNPQPPEIGRLGGEEFALLLPGCDRPEALRLCEKIRLAVAENSARHADLPAFTVSMGIQTMQSPADEVDQLLSQADKALYEAKATGRNRVIASSGTLPAEQSSETQPQEIRC